LLANVSSSLMSDGNGYITLKACIMHPFSVFEAFTKKEKKNQVAVSFEYNSPYL
jgi:hypothetical protein